MRLTFESITPDDTHKQLTAAITTASVIGGIVYGVRKQKPALTVAALAVGFGLAGTVVALVAAQLIYKK